jgi:hypothetical protein
LKLQGEKKSDSGKMSMLILPFAHQSTSVQIEVVLAFLADASHQHQQLP